MLTTPPEMTHTGGSHEFCLMVLLHRVLNDPGLTLAPVVMLQGYDVAAHVLACFGGAGGQHACAIATALGMHTIFVHRYSGILSAVGGFAQTP